MANKRFLDKIKNKASEMQPTKNNNKDNLVSGDEDENVSLGSLGDVIFKDSIDSNTNNNQINKEPIDNKNEISEESNHNHLDKQSKIFEAINKSIDEDFGGTGESVPLFDIRNIPKINSLEIDDYSDEEIHNNSNDIIVNNSNGIKIDENNDDETLEYANNLYQQINNNKANTPIEKEDVKIEEEPQPQIKRRRGRPKVVDIEPEESQNNQNAPLETSNDKIEDKNISSNIEPMEMEQKQNFIQNQYIEKNTPKNENEEINEKFELKQNFQNLNDFDVAEKVLNYVCLQTIKNLLETYKSKIYTAEFTEKLFNQYINGETNASNPLFKELICEAIDSNVNDPYLNELTNDVLNYIKGRNV